MRGPEGALVEGVAATIVGASEAEPHRALYQEALGWEAVASGEIPAATVERSWGAAAPARVLVLAPKGVETGRIHLLFVDGSTPVSLGHPGPRTIGFHGINCYVRDMDEAANRCERAGFPVMGTAEWEVESRDGVVQVRQARVMAPDDMELVFVQSSAPRYTQTWEQDPKAFATELTSVIYGTGDVDADKAFWGEQGLGLPMVYDTVVSHPALNRMTGLPEDAALRLAFGMGPMTARVEILGRADDPYRAEPSPDLVGCQRPGRAVGQVAWVVRVEHLERALPTVRARGGEVLVEPFEVDDPIHGTGRKAVVAAPGGIWIEMWEAQ